MHRGGGLHQDQLSKVWSEKIDLSPQGVGLFHLSRPGLEAKGTQQKVVKPLS
jgi:hypothetical protein